MNSNKEKLFTEFQGVSTEEWEAKILKDLKGADYNKKLIWRTREGFDVNPYYRKEHLEDLQHLMTMPGNYPFVRGKKINNNDWYIRQNILVDDIKKANEKALDILMKGINSLGFILDPRKEYSQDDLDLLLKNIFAEIVEINFEPGQNALNLIENHYEMLRKYNRSFAKVYGSINFDPLGHLVKQGVFIENEEKDFETARELIKIASHLPHFSVLGVNGNYFHDAGSSIVQELAFSLSSGVEYLTRLTESGLSINDVAPNIKFTFGIGSDYFIEIARLRAARLLWAHIVKAYGPSSNEVCKMNIHAVTSEWNMTVYDPHVNMLRSTTEAMSAIIGGVDSLTVRPFDLSSGTSGIFSERIAKNLQLLLKEESYLDKVTDPSGGSYYIENLTEKIVQNAWQLFLKVEERGGFFHALKDGYIQKVISETANTRNHDIATRKEFLLGTNQYPIFGESIDKEKIRGIREKKIPDQDKVLTEPIHIYRGAEPFENLRMRTDIFAESNPRPAAFMFTYGSLAMRMARSQFARNFFACAGYEVMDNPGFNTIEEGIEACSKSEARIVVICSSDDQYPEIAPVIFDALKEKKIIVIAGYPKEHLDDLKSHGIDYFIHLRSNILEELEAFHQILDIPEL